MYHWGTTIQPITMTWVYWEGNLTGGEGWQGTLGSLAARALVQDQGSEQLDQGRGYGSEEKEVESGDI